MLIPIPSGSDIRIRPAVVDDCPRMLELIRELAEFEKAPGEVTVGLGHFRENGFGPEPVWWAYVAEVPSAGHGEKHIIGFALYYLRYSTWKGKKMYLEDIIVTEAWRGKGAGRMLMDTIIRDAKAKGFEGISWQVLNWNEPAIRFYERYNARFDSEWVNVMLDI